MHPLFRIYFGDAKDNLFKDNYLNLPKEKNILELEPFSNLKKMMGIEHLIFLKQVHRAEGLVVQSKAEAEKIEPFSVEGDFIITNVAHVGIGIMTADCLPIILFDKRNQVVAVIHAGWRGSAGNIVGMAFKKMKETYNTEVEDVTVIFGPSAKVCCYKVGDDFIEQLGEFEFLDRVVQRRSDGLYFDLPAFNVIMLEELGFKKEAFKLGYNDCTVCNPSFHSVRRQKDGSGRNMTVVCLM